MTFNTQVKSFILRLLQHLLPVGCLPFSLLSFSIKKASLFRSPGYKDGKRSSPERKTPGIQSIISINPVSLGWLCHLSILSGKEYRRSTDVTNVRPFYWFFPTEEVPRWQIDSPYKEIDRKFLSLLYFIDVQVFLYFAVSFQTLSSTHNPLHLRSHRLSSPCLHWVVKGRKENTSVYVCVWVCVSWQRWSYENQTRKCNISCTWIPFNEFPLTRQLQTENLLF